MRKVEITDTRTVPYTDVYKEKTFIAWYSAGCPSGERLLLCIPKDELGREANIDVVKRWMKNEGWRERADILNQQVAREIEQRAVEARVEMLNRQAEVGKKLQQLGMDFFDDHYLDKPGEAIRAIVDGAALERSSRGLPDALLKVAEMKDEQLSSVLANLLNKVGSDQIENALNFSVEAEFKEIDASEGKTVETNE